MENHVQDEEIKINEETNGDNHSTVIKNEVVDSSELTYYQILGRNVIFFLGFFYFTIINSL